MNKLRNMPIFSIKLWVIGLALLVIAGACKSSDSNPPAGSTPSPAATISSASPAGSATPASSGAAGTSKIDPCKLLTSDELKLVQGETLKEASRSDRDSAEFAVAQCYYLLPTPANSVVVNVTTRKDGGQIPKEFWERKFEEAGAKGDEGETEKEESARPEKISGIGEEAYWEASGVGGALYILQSNVIFRISVGGASDNKTKLNKSKTLARKALARI